jgi:hypothetical protein
MATHKVTRTISSGSKSVTSVNSYTVKSEVIWDSEEVPDASTDLEFPIAIDVSAMKTFSILSDQDVTVETNNGTTPQETLSLLAGKSIDWQEGETALFAGDITSMFITNSSGSAATIKLIVGMDLPSS